MVGQTLICIWVSVVEVPSLGLLLGRDFLDGIEAVLSFARKLLRADHLCGSLIRLRQLMAGHFALQLIPSKWPRPGSEKWGMLGADGVLEVQVDSKEWLNRRLAAVHVVEKPSHEHLITEHAEKMADCNVALAQMKRPPISNNSKSEPASLKGACTDHGRHRRDAPSTLHGQGCAQEPKLAQDGTCSGSCFGLCGDLCCATCRFHTLRLGRSSSGLLKPT